MDDLNTRISPPEAIFEERRSTRQRFLRKVALTGLIGLGSSLALARPAWAQNGHCCPNHDRCSAGCPDPNSQYLCTDCDGSTCCACHNFMGNPCKSVGCGLCGGASRKS